MNAVATQMSSGRLVRAYFMEGKYEALRLFRTIALAVPMLVLPVLIYLLFGVVMAQDYIRREPFIANYLFVGYSIFAVAGPAIFTIGVSLAIERDAGLLRLKRALPAPPGSYILAKMAAALFFAVVAMALMISLGLAAGHLTMSGAQIAAVTAVLIAGSLPFCAIGLFVGSHVPANAAPAVANLVFLPMMWLSGLFIPLPSFLQPWAAIWPAFHLQQVALTAAGIAPPKTLDPKMALAVLAAVTLVFGILAIRRLARRG
jgi:ABC-2 type transport system permease protein